MRRAKKVMVHGSRLTPISELGAVWEGQRQCARNGLPLFYFSVSKK